MEGATTISLCGKLRLVVDERPREDAVRGRQGRLLLAYLVLHRESPVRRDALVEAIWGEHGPAPRDGALHPVLSRLRRALEPARIEGRDAIHLVLPEPAWIDVEVARRSLARARGVTDASERLHAASEVADLLAAGLLPGLEASWLDEERTSLERLRIEALELGAASAASTDPPLAETLARAAVAAAPFRESAWLALISALEARGNVAEALQAYDEVRRLLRDELGAVPGRELVALHGRLLAASEGPRAANGAGGRSAAGATGHLVERESEVRAIEAALGRLVSGAGGAVVFEGPAGIGKTRLLEELRTRAEAHGARVFAARAGRLEREYGFGVVRQLFEAGTSPDLLEGPAEAARVVLTDAGTHEGTFPILNGLHRLVERLAAERPLALCIDDLQWSDPASLRFIAYLARRLPGTRVLLAATIRTGEPDADEALVAELVQEPITVALTPRPLTLEATAELIRRSRGETPDPAFALACHDITAGNPLLLRQLLGALEAEGTDPTAAGAAAVRAIGPRAVARTVLLRLARLPSPAVSVARAVAVLGEQPGLPAVARLAGADEAAAAGAVQALARADILRPDASLGFVHPLVRDAVYHELTEPERGLEHDRAARLLAELGAGPERIAAQLLLAPPRGEAWAVTRLREAAHLALRRGAPDAAMRLLERAQAEPPPPEQQAALAFELGGSAAYVRGPAGVEPLRRAYAGLTDPVERARAAILLSNLLLFVRSPAEGVELARRANDELPAGHDDLRHGLRAVRLVGTAFGAGDPVAFTTLDDVRRSRPLGGPGGRALTAMTAFAVAVTSGPAGEASALAHEAFSGGLEAFDITAPIALASTALALGEPAEGLEAIRRYAEHARRQGEVLAAIGADLWGGMAHIWAGDLGAAMELLERAHEGELLWGTKLDAVMAYSAAFTAMARLERGDPLSEVAQTLHRVRAEDPRPDGARFWLASQAELALAEGRPEDALGITERLEPTRPPDTHPVWAPWRSLRARALGALGQGEAARRLAAEDLELARRVGSSWVIGRGLRILAGLDADNRVELARAAVARLQPTSARLELAKARAVLAGALTAAGALDDARGEWAAARALAQRCGAARALTCEAPT